MADEEYRHPRLAAIYDPLDPDRGDLDVYAAIVAELHARDVLDIGCGTGTFALLLADRGLAVTGVDPAAASLDVARGKLGADRVRWLLGDATTVRDAGARHRFDVATMTANVAQAIADRVDWTATLRAAHAVLRPGGYLVFETRDPAYRAWEGWHRDATHRVTDVPGLGPVETWIDAVDPTPPSVTFRWNYVFPDREALTSTSTLRFRERAEVEADLAAAGFVTAEVRDAPDRPGRELVFLARRD